LNATVQTNRFRGETLKLRTCPVNFESPNRGRHVWTSDSRLPIFD
jgi:hypothetical protein